VVSLVVSKVVALQEIRMDAMHQVDVQTVTNTIAQIRSISYSLPKKTMKPIDLYLESMEIGREARNGMI
jgi:hypothetical protein